MKKLKFICLSFITIVLLFFVFANFPSVKAYNVSEPIETDINIDNYNIKAYNVEANLEYTFDSADVIEYMNGTITITTAFVLPEPNVTTSQIFLRASGSNAVECFFPAVDFDGNTYSVDKGLPLSSQDETLEYISVRTSSFNVGTIYPDDEAFEYMISYPATSEFVEFPVPEQYIHTTFEIVYVDYVFSFNDFYLYDYVDSSCYGLQVTKDDVTVNVQISLYNSYYDYLREQAFQEGYNACLGEMQDILDEKYWEGHLDGYYEGYYRGQDVGYDDGYHVGYDDGYNVGYNKGILVSESEAYERGFKDGEKSKLAENNEKFYNGIEKWLVPAIITVIALGGFVTIAARKRREE